MVTMLVLSCCPPSPRVHRRLVPALCAPRSPGELLIYSSFSMLTYTPWGFVPTLMFVLTGLIPRTTEKERSVPRRSRQGELGRADRRDRGKVGVLGETAAPSLSCTVYTTCRLRRDITYDAGRWNGWRRTLMPNPFVFLTLNHSPIPVDPIALRNLSMLYVHVQHSKLELCRTTYFQRGGMFA